MSIKNLQIKEIVTGFYEAESTIADTLFKIVMDALTRYNLKIDNCRGQCYNDTSNVSGHINGLKKLQMCRKRPYSFTAMCTT